MKKLYWLAVQPTPYNYNLFKGLKESDLIDFKFCYSYRMHQNLPFDYKSILFEDDYFFRKVFGIDVRIVSQAFSSRVDFMVVGWNDLTKVIIMVIRKVLKRRYFFWTDSVNVESTLSTNKYLYRFKKWLLNGATKVFTTGEFGVEKMMASGLVIDRTKITSLPFFVEIPDHVISRSFMPDTDTLRLLQLSRVVFGKGLFNSVDAIALLIHKGLKVNYTIGGVGDEMENLKDYIAQKGMSNHVTLLGWLDSKSKSKAMNESHVLLHAVDAHDPFPLVVLESLAYGLPVVGTKLAGSVSDRVITGFNGVIVESNPTSIAEGISKLFGQYDINSLSVNARQESLKWPSSLGLKIVEDAISC